MTQYISMKKIVLMPVKNEDWILEYSLSCASLWADYIIIADQDSSDKTQEILKKFKKVIYIQNPFEFHSGSVRKLLLEEARKIPWNNLLFSLDADEIVSANFLDSGEQDALMNSLKPGDSLMLQWVNLWRTTLTYRDDDSIWSNSWKHFAFYDNREYSYDYINKINDHESRVPKGSLDHVVQNNLIKVLHFQFLWRARMLSKQRRYRVHDLIQQKNTFFNNLKLNYKYYPTKIIEKVWLHSVDPEWFSWYKDQRISIDSIKFSTLTYWYDIYILEKFQEFWVYYFRYLDIWDTDWDKTAKSLSIKWNFHDPRNIFIKLYHRYQSILTFIAARIPTSIKNKL